MSKLKKNNILLERVTFYSFIVLLISIPFIFWKEFFNGFDLIKFTAIKVIGGIFIILVLVRLIIESKSRKINLKLEKTLDPLVLFFLLAAVISTVFSLNPYVSYRGNYDTQIGLLIFIYLVIIYTILPYVIAGDDKIRISFRVLEIAAVLIAIFSIIQYFGIDPFSLKPEGFKRPVTTIGYPIFTAGFITLIFPFSVLNISGKRPVWLRITVPAVLFAAVILSQTRTTYIALAAEIVVISLLFPLAYSRNRTAAKKYFKYSIGLLSLLIIFITASVLIFPENIFVKRFISIETLTRQPRWLLWKDSIEMYKHFPLTGTGISMFPRAFDFFTSYDLRFAGAEVFVNPHNNFLNMFCTMGFLGGIAYLLILFQVLRLSAKMVFSSSEDSKTRIFYLASLGFILGYMVYGLADFDDITILFLLFVLLVLFKVKFLNDTKSKYIFEKLSPGRTSVIFLSIILILFSAYNIYSSYGILSAEKKFSAGMNYFKENNYQGFLDNLNLAVKLNPDEPYYRYKFASNINVICSGLGSNSPGLKKQLLEKALGEVKAAENNYRSKLECLALESLIELQLGNETEGLRLKDELFKTDTARVPYRINLAIYYMNREDNDKAIREINSVLNQDYKNENALMTKALYCLKQKDYDEAQGICRFILSVNPDNSFAKKTLMDIKEKNRILK